MDTAAALAAAGLQLTLLSVVVFQHAATADAGPLLAGALAGVGTLLVASAVVAE
ncbi:hypothetical protein [Halobaculum lipolyticum]|uniref:Uncharacterized protein n=1 Tax=Halobaculum lipolyticum TaxID=3032001 RepID=A0ABD5WJX6_9EURY|nr:hypothetical protein [Halobaculum sp. DT31]